MIEEKLEEVRDKFEELYVKKEGFLSVKNPDINTFFPPKDAYFFTFLNNGEFYLKKSKGFPRGAERIAKISYNGKINVEPVKDSSYTGKDVFLIRDLKLLTSI